LALSFTTEAPPTNLLVVSIDTLRRDHLGRYGGPVPTPFLDGLMADGVAFDDHMQCSNWTFASMSCTTMGRPGIDLDWAAELLPFGREPLPRTETLPSWLGELGFFSIVNCTNDWFSPSWSATQGYDQVFSLGTTAFDQIISAADQLDVARAGGLVTDRWMLHAHVMEPHPAYDPPEEYLSGLADLPALDGDLTDFFFHYEVAEDWPELTAQEQATLEQHMRVRYAGEVQWLDDQLREAFAELDARGLLEDTLVVVYSDHGEAFWEHGHQAHAQTLHAEETDAVLFFWSETLKPGTWTGPTHATDLAATLVTLYGDTPDPRITGLPLGTAPDDRARFTYTQGRQGTQSAVQRDGWKLLFDWSDQSPLLYDRRSDPGETTDVSAAHPDVFEDLWALLVPEIEALDAVSLHSPSWPPP
jgi:arylsulfatase A-like enzyme